jgi:hypothetical protein
VELALGLSVDADDVAAIDVDAGFLTVAMEALGQRGGLTPIGVTFSVARSLAVALSAGRLTHEELDPRWLEEHAGAVRDLAARVSIRHDWALTLETLRGTAEAGASVRDVPLGTWPRVLRRMREAGMDETRLSGSDLRALATRREVRRELRRLISLPGGGGIAGIDTAAVRLAFPARLRVRLRSGRTLEAEGVEPGGAGAPVPEQRAVVDAKCALVGELGAALPSG